MCKGAVARHGNPVFASETEASKKQLWCKNVQENETRKAHSVLWQEVQIDIDHT